MAEIQDSEMDPRESKKRRVERVKKMKGKSWLEFIWIKDWKMTRRASDANKSENENDHKSIVGEVERSARLLDVVKTEALLFSWLAFSVVMACFGCWADLFSIRCNYDGMLVTIHLMPLFQDIQEPCYGFNSLIAS